MNACEAIETQLDDFVAGRLPLAQTRRVEHHLKACATCRDARDGLLALRRRVAELPAVLEPRRDLWPSIASQINATPSTGRRRRFRVGWLAVAAAASVLAAACAVQLLELSRPAARPVVEIIAGDPPGHENGEPSERIEATMATAETAYVDAANGFLAQLESPDATLSPESRRVLEGNLHITNLAISDLKAALKQQPTNLTLARKLLAVHERRVEMLQQVTHSSLAHPHGG